MSLPKPSNFSYVGRYTTNIFASWFWFDRSRAALGEDSEEAFVKTLRMLAFPDTHFYIGADSKKRMETFVRSKLSQKDYFTTQSEKLDAVAKEAFEVADHMESKDPRVIVAIIMEEGRKIVSRWSLGYFIGLSFDPLLEELAVTEGIDLTRLAENIPRRPTLIAKRQKDLLALKQSPNNTELLERHLENYSWISEFNYAGAPLTLEQLIREVAGEIAPAATSSSPDTLDSETKTCLAAAAEAMYANQAGSEYFQIFCHKTRPLIETAARETGLTYEEILYLLPTEILEAGLSNGNLKSLVERRMRSGWCLFIDDTNTLCVVDDADKVKDIVKEFSPEPTAATRDTTIAGRIGNKGRATGMVKIVNSTNDLEKVQKGDVLVTSMTTPDHVPAMQRASAIVTDEGGLLCHAVIISRELGVPCIVGTKIATKVLHDGDEVEVDAEKGIVRILKRI